MSLTHKFLVPFPLPSLSLLFLVPPLPPVPAVSLGRASPFRRLRGRLHRSTWQDTYTTATNLGVCFFAAPRPSAYLPRSAFLLRLAFFFFTGRAPAALQLFRLGGAAYPQERRHWDSKYHTARGSPGSAGALRVPLAQQQAVRILCPVFRATRASKKKTAKCSCTYLDLLFCCASPGSLPT